MVSLRDVARAAGVSPATASRALAQPSRVSEPKRALVRKAAADLGYPVPTGAGGPAVRECLGLVVPDLESPFFAGIAKAFQRRARAAGLSVLVADSDDDPRQETGPVREMGPHVRGIVLCSPRMSDRLLAELPSTPPILLVNRESARLASVTIDNQDGMRQAVQHLYALGHRRVAYAGGHRGSWSDAQRRQGLAAAAGELPGLQTVELGHFPSVFVGGVAAADLVLGSGATAVIAHNDLIALGILDRLLARGTAVPEQVSVVGFDDVPAATHVSPALTTVAVPLGLLGRTAVDVLLGGDLGPGGHEHATLRDEETDAERPWSRRLPVSLVVRASTGPAPATTTVRDPA